MKMKSGSPEQVLTPIYFLNYVPSNLINIIRGEGARERLQDGEKKGEGATGREGEGARE